MSKNRPLARSRGRECSTNLQQNAVEVGTIARSAGTGTDICTRRRNFKQPVPVPFPHQAFSGLIRLGSVLYLNFIIYLSQSFFRTRRS